jgi:hypothetical protein
MTNAFEAERVVPNALCSPIKRVGDNALHR